MCHEDNRLAEGLLQAQKLSLQLFAGDRVGRTEGLVHEHHRRICGERPCHSDALLLAARELLRVAVREILRVEFDGGEQLVDAVADLLLAPAEQLWHDRDVLGDGHVGEQSDLLDHVADVASQLVRVEGKHVSPVDRDGPARRLDDAVDHLHGRCLATAARADEHDELTRLGRHGEILHRRYRLVGVALGHVVEHDAGTAGVAGDLKDGGIWCFRHGVPLTWSSG